MSSHWLGFTASLLGLIGGALLSADALGAVTRVREEKGKEEVELAMGNRGGDHTAEQSAGTTSSSSYTTRLSFARRSVWLARSGFGLMTAGFLFDLLAKL